ncbi:PREDICTED: protein BASIC PENTACYSTEINE2-like isoform X2 [Camelina sativa]|nr:PREDICTED: protein BASIC PENTACYSTEINE2-like isoform X2 [Camelina sativa]
MDDDGFRNWGYYEPAAATFKGNLGLQLMSTIDRNTKPFLPGRDPNLMIGPNGSYHHQEPPPIHMSYNWINQQKDKFFNMLPVTTSPNYGNVLPETSSAPSMQMNLHHHHHHQTEENPVVKLEDEVVNQTNKKRKTNSKAGSGTTTKAKKPRKPKDENSNNNNNNNNNNTNNNVSRVKPAKKSVDMVINGVSMDISGLPVPVCTCTGAPQQCYRWGCGGWQSACCTTNISMHPLPMSTKRRGARISGRKMSQGAFKKVLEKLASDGFNFGNPIDLKSHWARHGTNKFVTIR